MTLPDDQAAKLRQILAQEYKAVGSTIPFELHEKHDGLVIKAALATAARAYALGAAHFLSTPQPAAGVTEVG